ncbi:MAG: tetratricopeptide repeat protein [Alphaproteobacteria bacterium]
MRRHLILPLFLSLTLAACASVASPEDVQMSNALCAQGKTLLAAGKNADARDVYASATHRDEQNARAWNGLGAAYDMLGKRAEAMDAYQHAIELAPNDVSIVNNLAHLYIETGDAQDAITLLQPFADAPNAPLTLRQNMIAARKAARVEQTAVSEIYADLGSYPTEGMAQGHMTEIRNLLDDSEVVLAIVPEVKTGGGIPTFTIKATGRSPQSICDDLNPKAFPCIPRGQ